MIEALACFVGVLLLHAIATRLPPVRQTVPKLILIGGLVGLVLAARLYSTYGLSIVTWAGLLLFGLLCELYVFCFTLTMNSVSSRLLILLLRGGPSDLATLALHADRDSLVSRRVETLVANGFLEVDADGPRLTDKGRRTLRLFERVRAFFRPLGLPNEAD
jgi:hypothetical protein